MNDIAIRVENLSKRYRIGRKDERQDTLVGTVLGSLRHPLRSLRRLSSLTHFSEADSPDVLWALKDVSFDVPRGEVLGVIGRNGAGKSTLLKILARITYPTHGRVELHGRVASLLEVGTGFHPELTGRENVYLNGTILGMTKPEIDRKFDEIVDFSGIEKFIDTPVKRYSSGMAVRLAFSVAAHLEPEILLVDEVLAVGDTEFQRKCLGKMESVARSGRTIVFVSHQLAAIEGLCERCLLLLKGNQFLIGETKTMIALYLNQLHEKVNKSLLVEFENRSGTHEITFTDFYIEDKNHNIIKAISSGQDIYFVFEYSNRTQNRNRTISIGFSLHSVNLLTVFGIYNDFTGLPFRNAPPKGKIKFFYKRFPLTPGEYQVQARMIVNGVEADWPQNGVGTIIVEAGDFYNSGNPANLGRNFIYYPEGIWSIEATDNEPPVRINK